MAEPLSEESRALMDDILDQLIPANPERGILAAGAAGVGEFIERNRANDREVAACIDDLLGHSQPLQGCVTPEAIRQLEVELPEAFETLLKLTYMGYYSRPENRQSVGVGSWPVHPKGYDVQREDKALLSALTEPVRARGPVYRQVQTNGEDSPL